MYKVLDKIKSVSDVKNLDKKELTLLASDLRDYMVDVTSKNGGHIASSLGVTELTIALIRAFDFPVDKIIWDVGHQSYAYKILTDRKEKFTSLRTFGGISGFPKRNESAYDSFDTGHSSTSISAGLGMCVARDLSKENYKVVAVIGDGSLTGGMAFEALENLERLKSNFIIILNDNEMSISKASGGLNKALLGIRTSSKYGDLKKKLKETLEKSKLGLGVKNILVTFVNILKQLVVSEGMFFENLNINYVGPIDGHDIKLMEEVFETAKNIEEPVVIHIKTVKGKGYKPAEENPTLYHGVGPYDKETGEIKKSDKVSYTKVFSKKLIELAEKNDKIVAITAAMADGTGLTDFSKRFPDRFFDVNICEQHAVTFAAGLATDKIIPVVCIYSSFLQRGYDQIVHDVCMQNLHVVFAIDRAGLVGADGETHQGSLDISYLRSIPNMTIMAPKNDKELCSMLDFAVNNMTTPVAIRYPRGAAYDNLHDHDEKIIYGKSELIHEGKDKAIFALGSMVSVAENLYTMMKNKPTVVNARFAKPIDFEMMDKLCKSNKEIIIMEEGTKNGGISDEISSYIHDRYNVKVSKVTLPDEYIKQGDTDSLYKSLHIDSKSLCQKFD